VALPVRHDMNPDWECLRGGSHHPLELAQLLAWAALQEKSIFRVDTNPGSLPLYRPLTVRTTSDLRMNTAAAAAAAAALAPSSPRGAAPRLPPSPLGRPPASPPRSPQVAGFASGYLTAEEPSTPQGASPRNVVCRICEQSIQPDLLARHSQVRTAFRDCTVSCVCDAPDYRRTSFAVPLASASGVRPVMLPLLGTLFLQAHCALAD